MIFASSYRRLRSDCFALPRAVLLAGAIAATHWAAAAAPKPNILFAIADDWSCGHAGAYGCDWVKTPAFDRVARQGVLFTRAYTPNAKCAPSRSCILTGRNPWQLKAACNHYPFFPPEFKTFPEALGEHGYFVGMTAKGWGPGVATNAAGQPRRMTGREFNDRKTAPPAKGIAVNDYAANFADFLKAAPKDTPWCFWFGCYEPHRRYEFGSGVAKGGKTLPDLDRIPGYWPDNEAVRNDLLDYAFEVEHFDQHLSRMLALLEDSGALSRTLVLVTSDNGMPFPRAKSHSYQDSNHLPLAVMWPQGIRSPGRVVEDYISFVDFAPTLVELAGLRWSQTGMAPGAGQSLASILFSDKSGRVTASRDHVLLGKERHDVGRPNDWGYPIRGIVKNDMLYLRNFEPSRWPAGNPETGYLTCDASPTKTQILRAHRRDASDARWALCFGKRPATELYDLKQDPDCLVNLAGRSLTSTLEARLQRQLFKELKAQNDPRMFGTGEQFERLPYSDPINRDFYHRFRAGEAKTPGWVNESDFEIR
ncbi:MAG TPA: sulfatase [Candidatus Paceibacterota bacterium]|nr:sulfatase [Verrucomicrobiota bacterium]HSA13049.1 sulfatase [Candidatus Paceibacterota bacterium]